MLMGEMLLKGVILVARRLGLLVKKLILNGSKKIRISGLAPSPFAQVRGKESGFLGKSSGGGSLPTLASNCMVFLFLQPPILKAKWFSRTKTLRIKNGKNGSVVAVHHWQVVNRRRRKSHAPFCIA